MSGPDLSWHELRWQRPLPPEAVAACLRQWATDSASPLVVVETRSSRDGIRCLVGHPASARTTVLGALAAVPAARIADEASRREPVAAVVQLRMTTRHRPLRTQTPEALTRALYTVMANLQQHEQTVIQLVLGSRRVPLAVPTQSPSSLVAPWYGVAWRGDGGVIDGEKRTALRSKVSDHGFACAIRLGVAAASTSRQRLLLRALVAAVRTIEAPGAHLRVRRVSASAVNAARTPWVWPLRLGVPELVGLTGWPLGDDPLPGLPDPHPRLLPADSATIGAERVIGEALEPSGQTLHLPVRAALQHLHVIGPTGTGKSTLLANLAVQDITAGRSVVVVEPKGDLVRDILARVPADRRDDVVVLDASDPAPVGLNPLAAGAGPRRPELVADNLLSVFKQLYGANVGPRSQDIGTDARVGDT